MNRKIASVLKMIFWILFIAFLCDVMYEAICDIASGFKGNYPEGYTYGVYSSNTTTLAFAIILPALSFILLIGHLKIQKDSTDNVENSRLLFPILLILSAFVLRLTVIWALGLHTTYNSDIKESVELANGLFPYDFEKFSSVSSWAVWPVYLRVVRKIFGSVIVPGLILNALYTSLSAGLIYWIILTTTKNRRWAVASAEIYAIWPMNVLFAASLRPENVNIFLSLVSLALLICAREKYRDSRYKVFWVLIVLSSASIAVSGFFKKMDLIFLCAIGIIGILFLIEHFRSVFKKNGDTKKLIIACSSVLVFLVSYKIFVSAGYLILDQAYVQKVNRNPTAHYIEIGLSPWSDGTNHGKTDDSKSMGIYRYYARQAEYDYKIATKRTFEKLFSEIKQEKNLDIAFFQNKLRITWANQAYFNSIVSEASENSIINRKLFAEMTYPLVQIWYTILLGFILLGTSLSIARKELPEICFFSALFLFGFMLLMLICETQPRYKYAVYPYMSVLAGRGIEITSRISRSTVIRKKEHTLTGAAQ